MRDHIIVCGMGQVGYRIVDLLLRLGEPVEVVTMAPRPDWQAHVEAHHVRIIVGDARDEHLLMRAGLMEAKALIAATDQDLVNIEVALDAVRLRPDLAVVVRLFDQGLAKHLESSFDIRRALGMSSLAGPSFAAAAHGERSTATFSVGDTTFVMGRHVVDGDFPFVDQTVQDVADKHRLFVITREESRGMPAETPSPNASLSHDNHVMVLAEQRVWNHHFASTGSVRWQWLVAAIHSLRPRVWLGYLWQMWRDSAAPIRTIFIVFNLLILTSVFVFHRALKLPFVDALYFVVTTVTTVGYGDISLQTASDVLKLYGCCLMLLGSATMAMLFSIVTDFVVTARFQQLLGQQRIPDHDHVIVVGVGNLGFKTADELIKSGTACVAIDKDASRDFVEELRQRIPVLIGDGRVATVLSRAGVERAMALVATSGNDLMNLAVALAAKQINPNIRTVVRLFDSDFANKVQTLLNVDVAQSGARIAAPTFVAAALHEDVQNAFIRGTTMFMVVHSEVKDKWDGRKPDSLKQDVGLNVLLKRPPGAAHYTGADGDTPLVKGDRIVGVIRRELSS